MLFDCSCVLLLQEQAQCTETAQFVDYPHVAADGCVEVAEVVDSSHDEIDRCVEVAQAVDCLYDTFHSSASSGVDVKEGGDSNVVGTVAGGELKQGFKRKFMEAYVEVDGMESLIRVTYGRVAESE
jgi:hypothetical protein